MQTRYDDDLLQWIDAQVQSLQEKKFSELDIENLVEELDGMKKQSLHELDSRLTVLIMHLLKCQHQRSYPQGKWRSTLLEQRRRLSRLLSESPSLHRQIQAYAQDCYPTARARAALETRLHPDMFPPQLPYSIAQLLDDDFTP